MTETWYEQGIEIQDIVKAIHNPEERQKWDKDIEHAEVL